MISDLSGVPLLSDPDPGPGELGGGGHRGHGEAGDHVQSGEARPPAGQGLGVTRANAHHLRHDAPLLILVSGTQKYIIESSIARLSNSPRAEVGKCLVELFQFPISELDPRLVSLDNAVVLVPPHALLLLECDPEVVAILSIVLQL